MTDFETPNVLDVLDSVMKKNNYIFHVNSILSGLKIGAKCKDIKINKHLAFFDLVLDPSASISKLENKLREISIGIKSKTVPIMQILPSQGIVRLQVAIDDAKSQSLESLYSNYTVPSTKDSLIPILLGETNKGDKLIVDFAKNPHTLIAGGTGSGKSVLLHNIISNIIYLNHFKLRDIELVLVDPKQVEFVNYTSDFFKNYVKSVINDYNSVCDMLTELEDEMNYRYSVLKENNIRSIEEYPNIFS